jgi:branched-chain amino acid transport system substrate-binding protein
MMVEQMVRQAPGHGITLEPLRVDLPMEDFSPVIARIVAMEQAPDVVLIHMTGDPSLVLLQQLLDAGIGPAKGTLLLAGRAALDSTRLWELAPAGELTAVIRRGPWYTSLNDIGRAFYEKYRLLSNQWPEWPAFAGYDSLYLLAAAAAQADTVQPAALLPALEATDLTLAGGRYLFPYGSANPPDGVAAPASWWHQWLDPQMLILQYRTAQQDDSTLDVVWPPLYSTVDGPVLR